MFLATYTADPQNACLSLWAFFCFSDTRAHARTRAYTHTHTWIGERERREREFCLKTCALQQTNVVEKSANPWILYQYLIGRNGFFYLAELFKITHWNFPNPIHVCNTLSSVPCYAQCNSHLKAWKRWTNCLKISEEEKHLSRWNYCGWINCVLDFFPWYSKVQENIICFICKLNLPLRQLQGR